MNQSQESSRPLDGNQSSSSVMKLHQNDRVNVTLTSGIVVEGYIVDARGDGGPLPFYPNPMLTKYGNGGIGRTEWGYRVSYPIIDLETKSQLKNEHGYLMRAISWFKKENVSAIL